MLKDRISCSLILWWESNWREKLRFKASLEEKRSESAIANHTKIDSVKAGLGFEQEWALATDNYP